MSGGDPGPSIGTTETRTPMTEMQAASGVTRPVKSFAAPAARWMVTLIAVYLVAAAVLLFTLLTALVAEPPAGGSVTVDLWWRALVLGPNVRLLMLAAVSGALGSVIHAATSLADYIGNQRIVTSWLTWYAFRPVVGGALAVVLYLVMRAGLLSSADGTHLDAHGVAAVAALTGMFSKQATDKLDEIFRTMFQTAEKTGDAQRSHKLDHAAPRIVALSPAQLTAGSAPPQVVVSGVGFSEDAVVTVNDAPRPTRFENGRLVVSLTGDDAAHASTLSLAVVNPDGATSAHVGLPVS